MGRRKVEAAQSPRERTKARRSSRLVVKESVEYSEEKMFATRMEVRAALEKSSGMRSPRSIKKEKTKLTKGGAMAVRIVHETFTSPKLPSSKGKTPHTKNSRTETALAVISSSSTGASSTIDETPVSTRTRKQASLRGRAAAAALATLDEVDPSTPSASDCSFQSTTVSLTGGFSLPIAERLPVASPTSAFRERPIKPAQSRDKTESPDEQQRRDDEDDDVIGVAGLGVDASFDDDTMVEPMSKRGPKRRVTFDLSPFEEQEEVVEKAVEVTVEKEEKLSIEEMVNRICEGGAKGEMKLIKTLIAMKAKFADHVDKNLMRRILWTTKLAETADGRRLQQLMFFEIGCASSFTLLKKRVIKEDFKALEVKNYGLMLMSTYRTAIARDKDAGTWEDGEGPITNQIITGCEDIANAAICIPGPIGEKFMGMLQTAVEMPDRVKYDGLIYNCLEPHLWRMLNATHDQVRYNASRVLLRFYPITNKDIPNPVTLKEQWERMITMLSDECVEIRREATHKIQKVLANFYSLVPLQILMKICEHILKISSFDSIPAVRVAVLEGFCHFLPVSEAFNMTEKGLIAMMPRLVEDRSEKVRLAAVRLLLKLRGHKFIKYFKAVPMEVLMGRLECESSDAVRAEIVKLVVHTYMPIKASADDRKSRIVRLVSFGRNAALSFHRLVVPLALVPVEDAVAHLKNVCVAVYKNWRKGMPEGDGMASVEGAEGADTTMNLDTSMMSNMSMDTSAMSLHSIDEEAFVFRRDKILLECAVVLWASIAKELKKPNHEAEKKRVDGLMSNIFKKMFVSFRQTSLLGTVMCIGSLLPSAMLEEYSIKILSILKEKSVEDEMLGPYLAAGASWRIEELMQIVKDGLYELPSVIPGLSFSTSAAASSSPSHSPQKKRARKSKLSPVERIRQALHYLKYSLGSEPTSSKLLAECKQQLIECFEALSHVHSVMDAYLDSLEADDDSDEELRTLTSDDMLSLYQSAAVLAILLMEMSATSASATVAPSTTRSRRAAPAASTDGAETEDEDAPSTLPYSLFFFASLHWMEASLIPRIGRCCSSIVRPNDVLLLSMAKVTLQHAETVLAACPRPPRPPTHATMVAVARRLLPRGGAVAASDEEDEEVRDARGRSSSVASSVAASSGDGRPPKSYLERLSAMLAALLHSSTPIVLLRATLRLHEIIMGMDSEEGVDACAEGDEVTRAAIAITKRAAEQPYDGEELRQDHVDALLAYSRVAIAKSPAGPDAFVYYNIMGPIRANCMRLLRQGIQERGIEDVTDHTYDLHPYIQLFLHRYIFRSDNIYREFRGHVERFTIAFVPSGEEEEEGTEQVDEKPVQRESAEERRERVETARQDDYMRFVVGCMLLRLSAPAIRQAVIMEKRDDKARRSIQSDIKTGELLARLDQWKEAVRIDDGTETILREMIGPK